MFTTILEPRMDRLTRLSLVSLVALALALCAAGCNTKGHGAADTPAPSESGAPSLDEDADPGDEPTAQSDRPATDERTRGHGRRGEARRRWWRNHPHWQGPPPWARRQGGGRGGQGGWNERPGMRGEGPGSWPERPGMRPEGPGEGPERPGMQSEGPGGWPRRGMGPMRPMPPQGGMPMRPGQPMQPMPPMQPEQPPLHAESTS